eukprot:CAMPEP_0194172294 /NCGR_PEP_ID=MMETSP0154-20130528/6772_1 /TAXON_ID=1049557 /ORGANISM="Thalassiothrix antarctica, Strain L6-D1" /LENGTH=508 /DNA_ID=CAMNT_0038884915 /DNA_START=94 /DNA_END=1620 /DNA_ORIENTATION=+
MPSSKKKKKNNNGSIAAAANAVTTINGSTNTKNTNTKRNRRNNNYNTNITIRIVVTFMKSLLFVTVLFGIVLPKLFPIVYPFGMALPWPKEERSNTIYASNIDKTNESLMVKSGQLKKIIERVDTTTTTTKEDNDTTTTNEQQKPRYYLKGPETVVFDETDGTMYAATEEGLFVSMTDFVENSTDIITAKVTVVADLGRGRPLGGKFTPDGSAVYIADAHLGLLRLRKKSKKEMKKSHNLFHTVEIVASRVYDRENDTYSPIAFADDVTIGPKSGTVYFTDASDIMPSLSKSKYNVMYTSKLDGVRRKASGRLLQYDPKTDEVTVLATNIHFANGITMGDADETYLLISSTFNTKAKHVLRYNLVTNTLEDNDNDDNTNDSSLLWTGFTDGIDCGDFKGNNNRRCFVAIPVSTSLDPFLNFLLFTLPHPLDMRVRTFLLLLPERFAPSVDAHPYGAVAEINIADGLPVSLYQDPSGTDISSVTGVTVHDSKLYLASLEHNYIGVYTPN